MVVEIGMFVILFSFIKILFNIKLKLGMVFIARLLVYCIKKDGEVVVDILNVKIDDFF